MARRARFRVFTTRMSSPSSSRRPFDVVLFGATGYTGRLVAEYLARHAGDDLRWGLAGRRRDALAAVRAELGVDVPLILADVGDAASLDAMVSQTAVMCTTVGPYALHGSGLVAACARRGTAYCDLTGEPHWVRRMIDAHHEEAKRTGARIVHCCGFDSIPSDLGVLVLEEHARARHGRPCSDVRLYVGDSKGGFSGGTVASILNLLDEAKRDPAVRRLVSDPYALNPEGERSGPDGPDQRGPRYDADVGAWTAPFVMAAINTRVVRRSNALLGYPWGKDFRYAEAMQMPGGAKGALAAAAVAAGTLGVMTAAMVPPARRVLEGRLPKSGEGPTAEQRQRGYFKILLRGKAAANGSPAFTVEARVEGTSDPGYGETAKMLGESAMCLAMDPLSSPGGVLTPAFAMGSHLVERLRRAGMTFEASDA